ncbi:tyrosine-type recombinase/integrase [Streptomyces sp. NPDC006706]|uniref:tyrosine-type recombinase/integrase n=1 Tax=Streptomyces sp. NPDC006706 TaxID=3364761 RepID=UPI00369B33D3
MAVRKSPLKGKASQRKPAKPGARQAMTQEYFTYLRATNNRRGRPYAEQTVRAYVKAVKALDRWMTGEGLTGDFTAVTTTALNLFLRDYFNSHGQGGTATTSRNIRKFFSYLEEEYGVDNPFRDRKLQHYSPPKESKPKTLSSDFVKDLLKITGSGKAKEFAMARDYAILRVLTEGLRSEELLSLRIQDIDLAQGLLQVVPLKSARDSGFGRIIPLQPRTVLAITRYLRLREGHKFSDTPWLWLGDRGRGQLRYAGLYAMLARRSAQAGYEGVSAHQWRHTAANDLLSSGVSDSDTMTLMGWRSADMLKVYAQDQAVVRATAAARKIGDRY